MTIRKPFFVVPMDFTLVPYFSTPVSGYPQQNLAKFEHVGLVWQHDSANGIGFFGADLGSAKDVDFFAAISTNGVTGDQENFTLRSGPSPAGTQVYTTGARQMFATTGQSPFGKTHGFCELPTVQTARYFEYSVAHTGIVEISHFVIGKKVEFDRFYDQGFGKGFEGFDAPAINAGGVPDIQTSAILRGLKFAFSTMSKEDFHNKFQPLVVALKDHRPVYICFDPQADQYRHSNTYFGWLRKPQFATIGATHPDWYSQELEILSQI